MLPQGQVRDPRKRAESRFFRHPRQGCLVLGWWRLCSKTFPRCGAASAQPATYSVLEAFTSHWRLGAPVGVPLRSASAKIAQCA